ncbi:hypothetical protein RE476_02840 [Methanolobus mangrovi]|uniref:Uncharacterized protein n=1 Tax=Methanolobus mangrovi TaxID=3072977 RepID=A0AA51UGI6_9EURY|nr:hypothetical protein [Methanolobus mangrovi]WMW22776.1 hypothetical protein RE476_02840 [Methanolobus mangrovi]
MNNDGDYARLYDVSGDVKEIKKGQSLIKVDEMEVCDTVSETKWHYV